MIMVIDDFFENLEFFITKNGFNKSSFAKAIGVKQSTVSNWFARKTIPAESLDVISDVLKIEPSELFERDVSGIYHTRAREIFEKFPMVNGKENPERWKKIQELNQRFTYLGGYEGNEGWRMLGRVLPGIGPMVIELLQAVKVTNENEKAFYSVCFLLLELAGEKGMHSNFYDMIKNHLPEKEVSFRKEQLLELAERVVGIEPENELVKKFKSLAPFEQETIREAIEAIYQKSKEKKSVS